MGSQLEYEKAGYLRRSESLLKELLGNLKEVLVNLKGILGKNENVELTCTRPEFIWSVEKDGCYDLIRFNYHESFNTFIKSMNSFLWWDPKGCWKYNHNEDEPDFIIDEIKDKFPEWKFIDKR